MAAVPELFPEHLPIMWVFPWKELDASATEPQRKRPGSSEKFTFGAIIGSYDPLNTSDAVRASRSGHQLSTAEGTFYSSPKTGQVGVSDIVRASLPKPLWSSARSWTTGSLLQSGVAAGASQQITSEHQTGLGAFQTKVSSG